MIARHRAERVINEQDHESRLERATRRTHLCAARWTRARERILSAAYLPVDTVRERAEQVADAIWETSGLSYEDSERLTELVFDMARPRTRREISADRDEIPSDSLLIVGDKDGLRREIDSSESTSAIA